MGLEVYLGRKEYPVKCQLYAPVYAKVGSDVKVISHEPSEIFIWCKETKPFETTEEREMNRRKKTTKGTLETLSLKQDEITIDWKIAFDDRTFIIESLTQKDDDRQQVMMKNAVVKTILNVRC